uniref:Protein kinase domain-containing protein n=1 Tax=Chromera velia CCMP2878 TaxID=1169474 RepID=A0A0G4H597_9ALVE|eukprot:Cvel_5718.t1-p1 / transcript=Cvel_5718.t1 / gene=Cvel_5718 / organism=Chromera_velia_CCMP2878 / gene_product=Probable serine/threonine-protein kinase drkA, putative / transcript_product=Probable serine/threonine-protein kinase drkA, putative / location=Cvel_scaffold270:102821-107894(-) / protein_length=375 / sequence_SO=supercontig / SO=protein_coding / is_pseudo=false
MNINDCMSEMDRVVQVKERTNAWAADPKRRPAIAFEFFQAAHRLRTHGCADGCMEMIFAEAATAKEAALRQRALRVATRVVEQDPKYLLPDGCRISSKEIEMLKPIGEGAYGKVWAATFRGALVAVKRMRVHRVDDRLLKDFLGELALMRFLRHPHVVLLIGALSKGSDMAIVLEYCARGSLWDVLHDVDISLSWGTRVRFARQICQGMLYLHRWRPRPILHRDLKSLNILVDASMNLKISDFGWARVKAAEGDNMTGSVGTYQWMAPEVLESSEYSEKADVFSFGVVLWEILSRQPPYPGMDPVNVATQVVKNGLRPEIPPDSPRRWVSLMNRCWAQDPKDRLDFAQILEELDVFAAAIEEQKSKRYSSKERKH